MEFDKTIINKNRPLTQEAFVLFIPHKELFVNKTDFHYSSIPSSYNCPFAEISRAFAGEPHLLSVSETELKGSFLEKLAIVGFAKEQPIAYSRLVSLLSDQSEHGAWYEAGSVWVRRDFRSHGVCHLMLSLFLSTHREKNILTTTTNSVARKVFEDLGFVLIPRKSLPQALWRASCVCSASKTGTCDNSNCKLAWGEREGIVSPCFFLVSPETFERL